VIGAVLILLVMGYVDALVEYSEKLLPSRTVAAAAYRRELVGAILSTDASDQERRQLVKLARYESSFREDVGRCRKLGPEGEVGPWQELARSGGDREAVCASLAGAAAVALERVRESVAACAHLPPEERLAVYARGRCSSSTGRQLSRARYTP
jgi:hypothetical protein